MGEGWRGVRAARLAVDHVIGGALSPRESALALFLTMGVRRGGCGLPRPTLNESLCIPPSSRNLLKGQRSIRFDLLWANEGIALEYDSKLWHGGRERADRDKNRQMVARTMGIDSIAVTNDMVSSVEGLQPLIDHLTKALLGRRPSALSEGILRKRTVLRRQLFAPYRFW